MNSPWLRRSTRKHVFSILCAKIPQKSTLEIISGTVTTETDETDEDVKGKDTSDGMVDKKVKVWDTAWKGIRTLYAVIRGMKATLKWCLMAGKLFNCEVNMVLGRRLKNWKTIVINPETTCCSFVLEVFLMFQKKYIFHSYRMCQWATVI